jgi:hypothetical protein
LYWATIGVVHGLTAGWLSVVLSHSDEHYPAQAIFWAVSCVLWMPLVTYGIAQWDHRRRLLRDLASEIRRSSSITRSSLLELADLRSLIVAAIQDNIRPVLVTIAENLTTLGPALDGVRLAALGDQLAQVSDETSRIIDTTARPEPPSPPIVMTDELTPLAAALDFDRSRPYLSAGLGCLMLLPLVVAISFRTATVNTQAFESEFYIVALVAALLLAGSMMQDLARRFERTARIAIAVGSYAVAGLAGGFVALIGPWQPASQQNFLLALLLPVAVPFAASALSAGVGLGNANLGIAGQIAQIEQDVAQFKVRLARDRDDIRAQVSALTHGPLRGKLAACAMALNFHAAQIPSSNPAQTEHIVANVRKHLTEVLIELDSLG